MTSIRFVLKKNRRRKDGEYPQVEVDKVDMYTARHSAASHYFNSSGATIGGLATMLGRSPNKIATYAHLLRRDDELADIASTLEI